MIRNISTDELKDMMDSGESFVLVNVLDADSFEDEHICGSINIPVDQVDEKAPGFIGKDETVIVYCSGPDCKASGRAADKLESLGFSDIWRFQGGIEEWKNAGLCLEGRIYAAKAA